MLLSPTYLTGPLWGSTMPSLIGPVCPQPGRRMTNGPAATAAPRNARRVMRWSILLSFPGLDLEVLRADRVVGPQLVHAAAEHDLALRHHVHPPGQRQRRLHRLL